MIVRATRFTDLIGSQMNTQLRFDIAGLCDAIVSGDDVYRLALYTDQATVQISDTDRPTDPNQLLQGKAEIAEWFRSTVSRDFVRRVVNYEVRPESITVTTTGTRRDGSAALYTAEADIDSGRICREQILIRSGLPVTTAATDAPLPEMLDVDPGGHGRPSNVPQLGSPGVVQPFPSPSPPPMPGDLPSNFLG